MNINYGFEGGRFYMDYVACSRPAGNMREESDRRAKQLYEQYHGNLTIALSSGIDSQSVLHSFAEQGLPVKTVFKHMPGYNDNELSNLKVLNSKYGIKTDIVEVDPYAIKDLLEEEERDTGIHAYSLLWKHFISLLPKDTNFIQMAHDPYVHIAMPSGHPYYCMSHSGPEISKDRAYQLIKKDRQGDYIFFADTPEFLYSILNDDIFRAGVSSVKYFIGNGLSKPGVNLDTLDRWDYYIKPLIYGKYWKNELEYFPKFVGFTNLPYIARPRQTAGNPITPDYYEFLEFLGQTNGEVRRFYQTWRHENSSWVKF